jgi:Type IIA topoisomerase (DNA gyrase/topo II, topoisomerase IV), B subunit
MAKPLKSLAKSKATNDLFGAAEPKGRALKVASRSSSAEAGYTARDIEVLEGLEPVRRRPGMYIGGTDEKALHHLFAEVIDNAMDEALAGHASFIEVELSADGFLTVTDNGRGIPVDPHPKFPKKSALEVIMCTLHSGGKFDSKVYETSGGLHGVGCIGRQRPLGPARGRSRARPETLSHGVRARPSQRQARRPRQDQQPPRHQDPLQPGCRDFRRQGRLQAAAPVQDGPFQGLFVRRGRNPLALRPALLKGVDDVPPRTRFTSRAA